MSQEKVDKYKKEKLNRRQTVRKEKIKKVLRRCVVGIVGVLLIAGIGYSAYGTYQSKKTKPEVEIDYTAFDDFSQQLEAASGEQAD